MKTKIFALLLFTQLTNLLAQQAEDPFAHLDKETEKLYWDFFSERMYNPENPDFFTIDKKEIGFYLRNATSQDSLIVLNLMKEIQVLVPNKKFKLVEFDTSQYSGLGYLRISLIFHQSTNIPSRIKYYPNYGIINSIEYQDGNGNSLRTSGYFRSKYFQDDGFFTSVLKFNHTNLNSQRKRYIEYTVLRSLCKFIGENIDIRTHIDHSIFDKYDFDPTNTEFKEVDRFFIHKLYSDDIHEQHKEYLISNYGWFKYNEPYIIVLSKKMPLKILVILIGVLLFILFYKKIFIRRYKNTLIGYLVPAISLAILFSFTASLYNSWYNHFIHQMPWDRFGIIFISSTIITIGIFILGSVLLFVMEIYLLPRISSSKQLKIFTLPFLVTLAFIIFISFSDKNIRIFQNLVEKAMYGMLIAFGRAIILFFNNISEQQIQEKELEISRLKEQKAKAEIQSLHSRINPHFLYNSLNSIAGFAHSDPAKTEQMAISLSDLFRYTINRSGKQMSMVKEEIEMVKTYLEIEKIRFGERMSYTIDMNKDIEENLIPMYIIQPLVENAIKHGISKINDKGEVFLSVSKTKSEITIEVRDNGPGFVEGLVSGYGLQSVHDILELTYGEKAGLIWRNEPTKSISVTLPINQEK